MKILDGLIGWSLVNRLFVLVAAAGITAYGAVSAARMPVDVFPDLTAPTVTVVTEAHGLAPQEVETLVTTPIESSVNGATDVRRVRSASGIGISVVWVEFDWGTDIHVARQTVTEKLQLAAASIPRDVGPPTLAPISSVMGEIMFIGVRSDSRTPLEVREFADATLRRRLLAIPGIAQVVPIGGEVKQFHVLVDPHKLLAFRVSVADVVRALEESNQNSTGGFQVQGAQESLIRGVGRLGGAADIEDVVVDAGTGATVRIKQLATVEVQGAVKRGEGSANGKPAVILGITRQPGSNTLELTRAIDAQLDDIERKNLPEGMVIERHLFRQADFIERAVANVAISLRDGAILVAIILFLFLFDVRTTVIALTALPISLLVALLVLDAAGSSINTMTLGGLTIAVGALVDDAIIDVENVFRRLGENRTLPEDRQRPALTIIADASREVRSSIVFATVIVMLVFLPLFFLSGVEGRLLFPLGLAYLVAIFASMIVALTLTPAMCAVLLPRARAHGDSWVVRQLKRAYARTLRVALRYPWGVAGGSAALLAGAIVLVPFLGRTFLPEFNEGALTISAVTLPGTSLAESDRLGRRVEEILLSFPEVVATDRRTGRAELDEHAQDVNASEIDARIELGDRSKEEFLAELRRQLTTVPGVVITIGGPIAHRIDHMLSGTRASIAVKLSGDDLYLLRVYAEQIRKVMSEVAGAVDVSIEQQVDVPQLAVIFDRERIARYGLRTGTLAEALETGFAGHEVTRVLQNQRTYGLVLRYPEEERTGPDALGNTLIDTPSGAKVPLRMLADIRRDVGPNTITRENVKRKLVIMANVSGRDLGSVVDDIRARVDAEVDLPEDYDVVYGGQFESQRQASRTIAMLGIGVVVGIFLLLYLAFRSIRSALLVMLNLPLALIGGVFAVYLGGGVLSVASLVGFITVFGIATRNGIMMISHYEHLMVEEGASLEEAVTRGSMERLSPILMTALCAGLALIPLVLAGAEPGNEIQAPMGVVILGGLLSATALNMIVVPTLYLRFARAAQPHQ